MTARLAAVLLIVSSLALAAPLHAAGRGGMLMFALSGGPDTLDPQRTSATLSFQVMKSLYDTLVEPDAHGVLVPDLAASWTMSPDGIQWTFRLKPNVRFHNGKVLDAGDVAATFTRILDPKTASPKRGDFAAIDRVEVVDPLTVRFVLRQAFAPFLAALGQGWGAILPANAIASGNDFGSHPIGTGPFQLVSWTRDSALQLGRFNDYFIRGEPALDGVTFQFVTEDAVKTAGLLGGQFDVVDAVDPLEVPQLAHDSRVTIVPRQNATVNVVAINNARKPWTDVRARQALWYAIDRKTVLRTAYGPGSTPVAEFMDVLSPFYVDLGDPYPYNPAKARQLLAEAGVAPDLSIDLVLPQPYAAHIKAGELVQAMLQQAGIQAKIRVVEFGYWLSRVYTGPHDFDLTIIGHTGKLDPDGRLAGYGDPTQNYVQYNNPQVVALLDAGRFTLREDLRKRTYAEALRQMTQDAMMVFLGEPEDRIITRTGVRNVKEMYAIDTYDLRTATK
ncbi:MAG TPA: ABC transporter substrate-binding protein [bacterium]|nr:ABC transporter substrate-binding protein [bacterium]